MKSLRLRLVLLLASGLGIAWMVAAWFTYAEARHEIDALFDAQLAQSAQVLLATTRHELHERREHGDDGDDGNNGDDGDGDGDDDDIPVVHEYEQKLAFQIWGESGLVLRSTSAPLKAMATDMPGYTEATINGQPCRIFTRWDARQDYMIQVAGPLAGREQLTRHIVLKMLLPTLLAVPALALLIWFAVGSGLAPLQHLSREVKRRAADRLDPVSLEDVPDEVLPLAQALNDLFERLHSAFDSERRFTADAAHELRTPLAALKTQAQVALRATKANERRTALENVLRGVDRATRLTEQLLTLARIDPETAMTGFELVELRSLAGGLLAELSPQAKAKEIELLLETGSICGIPGNPAQLDILLRNLLDNAIRYTQAGGKVSVAIQENHGAVVLTVVDSGPGIPQQERQRVLERFYRISGSGELGSGLGLSIVHRIAQLHGAQFELDEGEMGRGLKIRVIFPGSYADKV